MSKRIVATLALLPALLVFGSTPSEPSRPPEAIEIQSPVGRFATRYDDGAVSVYMRQNCKDETSGALFSGRVFSEGFVHTDDLELIAAGLESCADALDVGKTHSVRGKENSVAVEVDDGKAIVRLRTGKQKSSWSGGDVRLDSDNARTVARLLRRSHSMILWIAPRVSELQAQKDSGN